MIDSLLSSLWIQRLGWALLHFLWQGTVIALLYALIRRLLTGWLSAPGRYLLASVALAGMTIAPLATLLVLSSTDPGPTVSSAAARSARLALSASADARLLPAVVALWLAGVLFFSVRLLGGLRFTAHLRSTAHLAPPEWQETLERIAEGTKKRVRLMVSALVEVPTVIGWLRPAILVPVEFVMGLPPGHLEALLAHEFAHIRRHDYLANVLQSIAEAVLFYHPAVWWISEQVRAEREVCCDDLAVAASGDPLTYARALADLESRRQSRFRLAPAANGGSLVNRIRRLIEPRAVNGNNLPGAGPAWAMIALWLTGVGAAVVHAAQTPVVVPPPAVSHNFTPASPERPLPSPFADLAGRARNTLLADPFLSAQVAPPQNRPAASTADDPVARWDAWLNQDVVYIITDAERNAFRQLKTDAEREQFIQQFWLRRDPTPDTVENEFREEHYRRIAYANNHFSSRVPGWKTDRGRIYITFGPPDEVDSYPSSIPPAESWRYRFIENIGNDVAIPFTDPAGTGEYHMTTDVVKKDALATPREERLNEFNRLETFIKLQQPPQSQFRDLASAIGGTINNGVLPMLVRLDYVPVTASTVLTNISVQFENRDLQFQPGPSGEKATVNLLGRVSTMTGDPVATFEKPLEVNVPANMSQKYLQQRNVYQQSVPLAPGRYRLDIVAKDTGSGNRNNYETAIDVPQRNEVKLGSSSLILADSMEKLPARSIGGTMFAIGDVKVRPRLGNTFASDEKLGIYLELYNFLPDQANGKLSGSIEYEIDKAGSNEKIVGFSEEAGNIANASASQVTIEKMLPLNTMALGTYILKVTAKDRIGNQSVQQRADFTVGPPQ